jgi:hypothetical protein
VSKPREIVDGPERSAQQATRVRIARNDLSTYPSLALDRMCVSFADHTLRCGNRGVVATSRKVVDFDVADGFMCLVDEGGTVCDFREARARFRAQVAMRHAYDGNLPFGVLLPTGSVVRILQGAGSSEMLAAVVELAARFTTPPPAGYAHVLAIAEGDVMAPLVSTGGSMDGDANPLAVAAHPHPPLASRG